MSGFELSPGITPLLTGAFAVEFPLSLVVGWLTHKDQGFRYALAGNALIMGVYKLATDGLADPWDAALGMAALVSAGLLLVPPRKALDWPRPIQGLLVFMAVGAMALGGLKIVGDPLDPWDLFLGDATLAGGLIFLWGWFAPRRHVPRPPGARAPAPGPPDPREREPVP